MEEDDKKLISTFKKKSYDSQNDIQIDNLHKLLYKIIYDQETFDSKIENIIKSAKKNLSRIYKEIKNKKLCKNYYESSNEEIEINIRIRNIFYKFNLDISNIIYLYENEKRKKTISSVTSKDISINQMQGNLEEEKNDRAQNSNNAPEAQNVDDLFYHQIEGVHYKDILKNFCKNEEKDVTFKKFEIIS